MDEAPDGTAPARRGDALRALLVEDEPTSRRMIRHALDEAGVVVAECADAARSLEIAEAFRPDVVLLDLGGKGPGLSEGAEALTRWVGARALLLVGLVGLQWNPEESPLRALPNVLFLTKPVAPHVLVEALRARVGEASSAALRALTDGAASPPSELGVALSENAALRERCSIQLAALTSLDRIADLLAAPHDLDAMLGDVLRACLGAPGLTHGAIYFVREDGGARCAASVGLDEALALRRLDAPELFDRVLASGKSVTLDRHSGDAGRRWLLGAGDLEGAILAPIPGDAGPLGVLFAGSRTRDLASADWQALLHAVSGELGRAMTVQRWVGRIRGSESRYHAMLENASDAILVVGSDDRIIEVSRSAESLFQLPTRSLPGRRAMDLFSLERPEADAARLRRLLSGAGASAEVLRIVRRDGRTLGVEVSSSRVDLGEEHQVFVIVRDVSERETLQAQLVMAERLASMGELAASVGHEINNPLAAAVLNLEIVSRRLTTRGGAFESALGDEGRARVEEEVLTPLKDATDAIHRVSQIVRDLKSLSRSSGEARQLVDLRAVLDTASRIAKNEIRHSARLVKDFRGELLVEANEGRLGQVFLNLLVNAAQAITDGDAEENVITLAAREEGDFVVVEVSDTGVGIPHDIRDRIFEPFYTTKAVGAGTGLGLAICHRIVTGMNGVIEVESEPGRGSRFRVRLPTGYAGKATEALRPTARSGARRGRVLVLDDDVGVSAAISRCLSSDHDVATSDDGRVVLERLRGGDRFDLILCDLMMPKMSGMAFFDALVALDEPQSRRVVFITGGAFTPLSRGFLARVQNQRLDKPFRADELKALTAEYVDRAPLVT